MTRVALFAALVAAHAVALALLGPADRAAYAAVAGAFAKAAVVAAALRTALALRAGDYMRAVWLAFAAGYALLAAADVPVLAAGEAARSSPPVLALLVAGNAGAVYAAALLAYVHRAAGLGLASGWRSRALWASAVALTAVVVGFALRRDVPAAAGAGGFAAWVDMLLDLGDAATFLLTVPVLRCAVRLGAGRLAAAWWSLFLANLCWLLFDATGALPLAQTGGVAALEVGETVRVAACLATALAAVLYREVLVEAREGDVAAAAPAATA
jgi:hypothetical protein